MKKLIYGTLFFTLLSTSAMAEKARVLVIGDDHTQREMGAVLFESLNAKYDVHSYSICDSEGKLWSGDFDESQLRERCKVAADKDPVVHRHSIETKYPALSTAELVKEKGLIEAALKQQNPELVIIQLGDFMADGYTGQINEAQVAEHVEEVLSKLEQLAPNVPDCRWIAPVYGEDKSNQKPGWTKNDEQVKALNIALEKALAESDVSCTLIKGDDLELKEKMGADFTVDGLHLTDAASKIWADHIMQQLPILNAEDSGLRPCPREVTGPLSSEAESLLNDIGGVQRALEGETKYNPPSMDDVRRSHDTDRAFASAYEYGPPNTVQKGMVPQSKGGFFSGIGSFFSNIFKGIGNFFSGLFNGITGLFTGRSATAPIPLTDIPKNDAVSTDPLERHSDLLSDSNYRAPASAIESDTYNDDYVSSSGLSLVSRRTEMQEPAMVGGFRYDTRFDRAPRPDDLDKPDNYTPTPARRNERKAIDPSLTGEERLVEEGKRIGAGTWQELNELTKTTYLRSGNKACNAKLRDAYKDIDGGPIWGDLSLEERADRVRAHANMTFRKMKESERKSSNHRLHPILDSSVAVCISFIETRGTLNPHAMNYTMCQDREKDPVTGRSRWSTASGLGQMTRTTFRGLFDQGKMPITTTDDYQGASRDELFYAITDDVNLQMEVLLRHMNYEIKRTAGRGGSNDQILLRAVEAYDQDSKSRYLRMFARCHKCMKGLGNDQDPMHCYEEMGR